MLKNTAAALVMVRNEAYFIRQVLVPLAAACKFVLVGDTGSTDGTIELANGVGENVYVVEYGPQPPGGLTRVRKWLAELAEELGAAWAFQVDGDELWHPQALASLLAQNMPEGKRAGFITMASVEQDDDTGAWHLLDDFFSRLAIYPISDAIVGEYPFEAPESFGDANGYHYFAPPPKLGMHALHLHRCRRSPNDREVYKREEKRLQFSMVDRPDVRRIGPLAAEWVDLLEGEA